MGRRKELLKQQNIDRANRLLESRISRSLMTEQQKGDANNDGTVNQDDIDWIQANWLGAGDVYDSNDNLVNLDDLTLAINHFGQGEALETGSTGPGNTGLGNTGPGNTGPGVACDPPPNGCKPGHVWMPAPVCACQPEVSSSPTCKIVWASSCSQQHLATGGGLGGQNSWDPWLSLRQTGRDSAGCQHLQNVVNWTTDQLNSGVTGPNSPNPNTPLNSTQILRKTAKREWAQCQAAECDCPPLNVPALTGGPTPPPPVTPDPFGTDPLAGTGGIKPEKKGKKKKPPTGTGPTNPNPSKKGVNTKGGKDKKEDKELNEQINKMRSLWNYNK